MPPSAISTLPGGEGAAVGGEEQHRVGHLLGRGVAAERDHRIEELAGVGAERRRQAALDVALEVVVDRARRHDVDPDAPGRRFLGDRAHQPDQPVLGGGIGGDAGIAGDADHARGHDDAAAVAHLRQAVFAGEERALEVDRHHLVEHVLGIVGHRPDDAADAGIAEQHVDRAPARDRGFDIGRRVLGVGDVGQHGGGAPLGQRLQRRRRAPARSRSTSMTLAPSPRSVARWRGRGCRPRR